MRFRLRSVPDEPLNSSSDNVVQIRGIELPVKAQSVLGERGRVQVSNGIYNKRDDLGQLRRTEQTSLGRLFGSRKPDAGHSVSGGKANMPAWSNAEISSRSSSDILPTPTTQPGRPTGPSRYGSSTAVQPHQFYPNHQPSIESLRRNHYDASKQPLYVSQQTSASAVRDMGLRKGAPVLHEMASEPVPLRSALKHSASTSQPNGLEASKRPRKLDLASLFPQPKASRGPLLSPTKVVQSPSVMTDAFEYFPQETLQAELRRQGPNGRFTTYKSVKPPTLEPANSRVPRVKIFEPDIYDNSKRHTRRPPKGIQNWFDGFDISSDEEDQEPVELPANPPRPSVEAIPSDFSPYGITTRAKSPVVVNSAMRLQEERDRAARNVQEPTRSRASSRGSESSTVTRTSCSVALPEDNRQGGESRLAQSKLESESVLSLSSESGDERSELSAIQDSRIVVQEAEILKSHRPSIPPRKLHNTQTLRPDAALRKNSSFEQSSRSTPARRPDNISVPSLPDRDIRTGHSDPTDTARPYKAAAQRDSQSLPARSIRTLQSPNEREDARSAGGDTVDSIPSDASRVMAVTEEEMMLLELMRKKRAAMAKSSFSEGYRLALKQEQEHLAKRREAAHHTVLAALKERDEKREQMAAGGNSRESKSEAMLAEDKTQASKRYSVIRKQDVDKSFKMGRFLAGENHQEEPFVAKMARMERFLQMKPSLADALQETRPLSGTEIEADSLTLTEEDDVDLAITEEEDTEIGAMAPSPMQRLTEMSRDSPRTSPPKEEEIEEHHDKVRAFLASSRVFDDTSADVFPTPPGNNMSDKQWKRTSVRSSPRLTEVPLVPSIRERSPSLTPLNHTPSDRRQPSTPRQPLPRPDASDFMSEIDSALPAGSKLHGLNHAVPSLDRAPLEHASARTVSPPSVTTSHPSPLTPTFARVAPLDKAIVDIPVSDNGSFQDQIYTPEPEQLRATKAHPVIPGNTKRVSKRAPPRIDTKNIERVTSMSSISAGEDVLAAWAELGGGRDALAFRRRGR